MRRQQRSPDADVRAAARSYADQRDQETADFRAMAESAESIDTAVRTIQTSLREGRLDAPAAAYQLIQLLGDHATERVQASYLYMAAEILQQIGPEMDPMQNLVKRAADSVLSRRPPPFVNIRIRGDADRIASQEQMDFNHFVNVWALVLLAAVRSTDETVRTAAEAQLLTSITMAQPHWYANRWQWRTLADHMDQAHRSVDRTFQPYTRALSALFTQLYQQDNPTTQLSPDTIVLLEQLSESVLSDLQLDPEEEVRHDHGLQRHTEFLHDPQTGVTRTLYNWYDMFIRGHRSAIGALASMLGGEESLIELLRAHAVLDAEMLELHEDYDEHNLEPYRSALVTSVEQLRSRYGIGREELNSDYIPERFVGHATVRASNIAQIMIDSRIDPELTVVVDRGLVGRVEDKITHMVEDEVSNVRATYDRVEVERLADQLGVSFREAEMEYQRRQDIERQQLRDRIETGLRAEARANPEAFFDPSVFFSWGSFVDEETFGRQGVMILREDVERSAGYTPETAYQGFTAMSFGLGHFHEGYVASALPLSNPIFLVPQDSRQELLEALAEKLGLQTDDPRMASFMERKVIFYEHAPTFSLDDAFAYYTSTPQGQQVLKAKLEAPKRIVSETVSTSDTPRMVRLILPDALRQEITLPQDITMLGALREFVERQQFLELPPTDSSQRLSLTEVRLDGKFYSMANAGAPLPEGTLTLRLVRVGPGAATPTTSGQSQNPSPQPHEPMAGPGGGTILEQPNRLLTQGDRLAEEGRVTEALEAYQKAIQGDDEHGVLGFDDIIAHAGTGAIVEAAKANKALADARIARLQTKQAPLTIDQVILNVPALVQADPILARAVQAEAGQASVVATALGHLASRRRPLIYMIGSEALKTATGVATLVTLRNQITASGTTQLLNVVYVHTDPAVSQQDFFDALQMDADRLVDVAVDAVAHPADAVRQQIMDAVNANLAAFRRRTGQIPEALPPIQALTRSNTVTFATNAEAPVPLEQRHREERLFGALVTDALHVLVQQPDSTDAEAVADYSRAVLGTLVALSESTDTLPELKQDIDAVTQVIADGGALTIPPRPSAVLHDLDRRFKAQRVVDSQA